MCCLQRITDNSRNTEMIQTIAEDKLKIVQYAVFLVDVLALIE